MEQRLLLSHKLSINELIMMKISIVHFPSSVQLPTAWSAVFMQHAGSPFNCILGIPITCSNDGGRTLVTASWSMTSAVLRAFPSNGAVY